MCAKYGHWRITLPSLNSPFPLSLRFCQSCKSASSRYNTPVENTSTQYNEPQLSYGNVKRHGSPLDKGDSPV